MFLSRIRAFRFFVLMGVFITWIGHSAPASPTDEQIARSMGEPFYSGRVQPTPRKAEYADGAVELIDGRKGVIRYRFQLDYDGPARELMIRLFNKRIGAYKDRFGGSWTTDDAGRAVPIILAQVSDARMKDFLNKYALREQSQTLRDQGYVLAIRPDVILCAGRDNRGMVSGLASLLQLIHVRDGKLVVRQATIVDWPTFTTRYTSDYRLPEGTDYYDWMMLRKINGYSCGYADYIDWRGLTDAQRTQMKVIGDYIRRYQTMRYLPQIHIGPRLKNRPAVDSGNPADIETLLKTVEEVMALSDADAVLMLYDDVPPELSMPEEKKKFKTLGEANGFVAGKVYEHMQKSQPGSKLFFCPPHYQGLQDSRWKGEEGVVARQYMKDVHGWNKNIVTVWTGPVTESREITEKDIRAYQELLDPGRELFYWDNTWHYHQPLRNFHAKYPADFVDRCVDRISYININCLTPIGQYFSVTANDYYWNPEAFDVTRSWQNAAVQMMGPAVVSIMTRIYEIRGEDYFCFFAPKVDLAKFKELFTQLEKASWTPGIPRYCWSVYEEIAAIQKKASVGK